MSLNKAQVVEISEKCLSLVKAKTTEADTAKLRLEGAAEGIQFFLNTLVSSIDEAKEDTTNVSTLAKA